MNNANGQTVVAAVPDLFFAAKIGETAKQVGATVEFALSEGELIGKLQQRPALIILDLNAQGMDPVAVISSLKADPACASTPLLGFVRHEMADLIEAARRAGCDEVLSRNAFSKQLPAILSGRRLQEDDSTGSC